MSGSIESCTVLRTDDVDPETAVVRYQQRADGWYIQTPRDAEFRQFAPTGMVESTLLKLITEKYDARYGEPNSFEPDTGEQATLGGDLE